MCTADFGRREGGTDCVCRAIGKEEIRYQYAPPRPNREDDVGDDVSVAAPDPYVPPKPTGVIRERRVRLVDVVLVEETSPEAIARSQREDVREAWLIYGDDAKAIEHHCILSVWGVERRLAEIKRGEP